MTQNSFVEMVAHFSHFVKHLENGFITLHGDPDDKEMYNEIVHAETTKTYGFYDHEDKRKRYYDYIFSLGAKPSKIHTQRVIFRSAKKYVMLDKRKFPPGASSYKVPKKQADAYSHNGKEMDFFTDHDSILATFAFDKEKRGGNTSVDWDREFLNVFTDCWTAESDNQKYGFDHNGKATQILAKDTNLDPYTMLGGRNECLCN